MNARWIDVSIPLRDAMVRWPGDPPVRIERALDMDHGDPMTVSRLSMGAHTGTHMDAPRHFLRDGAGIDAMPLDAGIGRARVLEIAVRQSIGPEDLLHHRIRRGERLLFKTRNSRRCWKSDAFVEDFAHIYLEGARFLAARGVRLVGIDYLSVGAFEADGAETHRTLLGAGIWIVEGLDLSSVEAGVYEMVCLPLRLKDGDGAPARVALRPRPGSRPNDRA
jgi:arylformamidase